MFSVALAGSAAGVVVAGPAPGGRHTLFNTRLTQRDATGTRTRTITDAGALEAALRSTFALSLDGADIDALFTAIRDRPENARFKIGRAHV
mgnify:CR=1 FL=1